MTDPLPDPSDMLESLFAAANEKQQREEEAQRAAEQRQLRLREYAARRERLADAFSHAHRFTNEEQQQGRNPCSEGFRRWTERFVELGKILRECDEALEELCLQARLRAVAARTAPAAMKFACALLLLAAEANSEAVASALERANDDWELRRFVLWLPFILDQLWGPFSRADGLMEVAQSPRETSLEEHHQAEQALRSLPRNVQSPPGQSARVDQVLDDAARHQQMLDQLQRIEQRLETKRARVVEALHTLALALPNAEAYGRDHALPPDWRDVLADTLLQVCQAAREGDFGRGIEQILSQEQKDAGGNDCLAMDLYRRAWSGNRQALLELLNRLDELPKQRDNCHPAVPSQQGVWDAVRSKFDFILPWPPLVKTVHSWHPDVVEAGRVQDEYSPPAAQVSPPEPVPHRPLVGERTGRRAPVPSLARDANRERQSRYCQGFDPDWWLPALLAARWRTAYYPREASAASVRQWLELIDQLRIEYLGPFGMPEREAELRAERENDLGLLREYAPQLYEVVLSPDRSSAGRPHPQGFEIERPAQAGSLLEDSDTLEEPPREGGQADNQADNKTKKSQPIPENPDVLRLAKKIKKDRPKGISQLDSAREFCEGNERKAESLLRQVRRFPHLLE